MVTGGEVELAVVGRGVHLLNGGGEHVVRAAFLEEAAVGIERAWVVLKVVLVVELGGIDENGHDRDPVFPYAPPHERGVALVQGAHRGHEPYLLPLLAVAEKGVLEVNNLVENFHFLKTSLFTFVVLIGVQNNYISHKQRQNGVKIWPERG